MMQIKLKRFDKSVPAPEYKSAKAAAMDLYARQETKIAPQSVVMVPLNIALDIPDDHWVLLAARSSLHKRGVMLANGIGVGDADFCGDNDEYHAPIFNFTSQEVVIEKGERIVQMIVLPREQVEILEVSQLGNQDRGGFGSTGRK